MKRFFGTHKEQVLLQKLALLLLSTLLLSSCYSVRLACRDCTSKPDPLNTTEDYYRGKELVVIDTTISLKLLEGDFLKIEHCNDCGFHTLEYRVTLGDVLLSGITLGKIRKIRVKYVCVKPNS